MLVFHVGVTCYAKFSGHYQTMYNMSVKIARKLCKYSSVD